MAEIILAEHHDQVYSVWEERGHKNLSVSHVDFHCDMRGILIDRVKQTAIFTSHRETTFVDRGNYLAHAIMNGIVSDLKWVHGPHAGRGYDVGPIVSYETDLRTPFYKLKHRLSGRNAVSVQYEELLLSSWQGMRENEQLDLDWDGLMSVEYDKTHREMLIQEFLSKNYDHTPQITFLVYSPGYSDADRSLYHDFAKELSMKFKADITQLPETKLVTEGERFSGLRSFAKKILPDGVRECKRNVTRKYRKGQTEKDLAFYQ